MVAREHQGKQTYLYSPPHGNSGSEVQIQPEVLVIVFGLLIMLIYHSDAYLVNPLLAIPFKRLV
jgi:hypothetical protein